ncbi:MAG: mechanosensitive ion channel protein MscS, partial [Treponema sp.]|nr:mechanosensitive ion channel protein MscS [Treponema sp.]
MAGFLNYVWWNNMVKQWLLATGWIAGGLIGGFLCSLFLTWFLKNICNKTRFKLDDILIKGLERPLTVLMTLGGIDTGMGFLTLNPEISPWIDRGLSILFILFTTWGIGRVFDALISHYIP